MEIHFKNDVLFFVKMKILLQEQIFFSIVKQFFVCRWTFTAVAVALSQLKSFSCWTTTVKRTSEGDFVQRMNLLLRFQSEMCLKEKLKTLLSVMREEDRKKMGGFSELK